MVWKLISERFNASPDGLALTIFLSKNTTNPITKGTCAALITGSKACHFFTVFGGRQTTLDTTKAKRDEKSLG